jgi:hypothetical protein
MRLNREAVQERSCSYCGYPGKGTVTSRLIKVLTIDLVTSTRVADFWSMPG